MNKRKRAIFNGFVSSTTLAGDVLSFNTDSELDFGVNGQVYRDRGSVDDWDTEWPPKRVTIIIEVNED